MHIQLSNTLVPITYSQGLLSNTVYIYYSIMCTQQDRLTAAAYKSALEISQDEREKNVTEADSEWGGGARMSH